MMTFFQNVLFCLIQTWSNFKVNIVDPIIIFFDKQFTPTILNIGIFLNLYHNLHYIRNNKSVYGNYIKDINDINDNNDELQEGFWIYKDDNKNIKMIYNTHINENDLICKKCEFSIFNFLLNYNTTSYEIYLSKPYNYLLVGNKLNFLFFKWYMKKNHNIEINHNYNIRFIDDSFQEKSITYSDELIFTKNKIIINKNI